MPAPRPEPKAEATREAAKRGRFRSKTRAFISAPPRPSVGPTRSAQPGWCGPDAASPGGRPARAAGGARPPVGLLPVLDVPTPPPGDGGQLGLGIDRHREAHRLQHGQIAGRVGVGHRLLESQALGLGVVGQHQGAGLADRGQLFEATGEDPVDLDRAGHRRCRRTAAARVRPPDRALR